MSKSEKSNEVKPEDKIMQLDNVLVREVIDYKVHKLAEKFQWVKSNYGVSVEPGNKRDVDGFYPLRVEALCPLCSSYQVTIFYPRPADQPDWSCVKCGGCGKDWWSWVERKARSLV